MRKPVAQSEARSELPAWASVGHWSRVSEHLSPWLEQAQDSDKLALGKLCLQARQWTLSVRVFDQVQTPDASVPLQRRLAGNLAAFEQHHPQAYEVLIRSIDPCQYQLIKDEGDRWALVQQTPEGQALQHGPAPDQIPASAMQQLQEVIAHNHPTGCGIALCGMGDGSLLRPLVKHHWTIWGQFRLEPTVWLIEPDVGLVLHNFMIHDFTQEDGPILRGNCRWLLGEDWPAALLQQLDQQPTLRYPHVKIPLGRHGKNLFPQLDDLVEQQAQRLEKRRNEIWRQYPALDLATLVALLGTDPPRKPRVMFITSRLTTVLQYANRDCAQAFADMGWDTRLLIEPSPYEDTTPAYLLQELAAFEPDVIFMIDSLRLHASCVFPPQVLHVCWVQDDLPRLINKEAGRSIGPRDFVALPAGPWYTQRFAYPACQCLFLDKLTQAQLPASGPLADGDDLVFVTNAGRSVVALQQEIVKEYHASVAPVRELIQSVTSTMITVYEQGGHLHSPAQVRSLIEQEQHRRSWAFNDGNAMDQLVTTLFNRFNNTLYRQQVVHWLIDMAGRHGWKLSLYGAGWEQNPAFAPYARGRVAYGAALQELTARSKISLQVVPFGCMHQRLLNGLMAGGFFLVREHPWDRLLPSVWKLIRHLMPADGQAAALNLARVLPRLDPAGRQSLRELAALHQVIYDGTDQDPVRRCQDMIDAGCHFMLEPFPAMEQTFFNTPAQLEKQVLMYLREPGLRREIQGQQAAYVRKHLTYHAGLQRLMQQIQRRLRSSLESSSSGEVVGSSCLSPEGNF